MNEKFLAILDSEKIKYSLNEPMSRHTTFKIGGNADIFVEVSSVEQLKKVQSAAKECGLCLFLHPSFVIMKAERVIQYAG